MKCWIAHVYTDYEIGRMIVEEEQGGKSRADYGKKVLIDLSARLTAKFGRGWSVENLPLMRKNDGFGLEHTFCNDGGEADAAPHIWNLCLPHHHPPIQLLLWYNTLRRHA